MLKAMRKKAKIFIWVAAGSFIAFILLQWGMNITGRTRRNPGEMGIIAEVNGQPISAFEYQNEIERLSTAEAERLGSTDFSEEMMEKIRDRAFDALVSRKLLEQEVKRRKIGVTDEEILNVIRYSPPQEVLQSEEFQTDGEFDYEKYNQFIRSRESLPFLMDYERRIRETLPLQKLQLMVLSTAKITDSRVREEWIRRNERIKVEYIFIPPDSSQPVEISEEDVLQYYNEHKDELLEPEKASISYVFFEKKPSEEDELTVKERIEEVYGEALTGADFAELAQYYSEDPGTVSKGGDLGWITKGTMVKEFEDVAFSLKAGEISKPFRTPFGWHIVKVEERRKDKIKARHILLRVKPSAETLENMRNTIREFIKEIKSLGFEEAASKNELQVYSTKEFPLDQEYIPGFGAFKEVHQFILENRPGEVSYPIAKGNRYYVFKIVEKKSKSLPELEKVRSAIEKKIIAEKQKAKAREKVLKLYEEISKGASLRTVAKSNGLKVQKTQPFTRLSNLPGILPQSEFFGAAFSLGEGEISAPVETEQGYFIIKLIKKFPIDEKKFEEERESLKTELIQNEQQKLFMAWMENLKARAKIKDHRRKLL